jgi:type I restriction enzyme S subunit
MFIGGFEFPVSFASYLVRLRLNEESIPGYFAYLLNTPAILGVARSSAFVAIGQCNLNPTRYSEIVIAVPPLVEQQNILEYLDRTTSALDRLASLAGDAIGTLRERRSALISAAVTGKIDVRGLAKESAA